MEQRIKYGTTLSFLLMAGLALYGYFFGNKPSFILNKASIHIAAKDLISIAGNKEPLFDKKYLYKIISVRGAIQNVHLNEGGTYTIRLGADPQQPSLLINCVLDTIYNTRQPDLHTGDSCTIQGTCAGQLRDIIMVQCIIEP